SRPGPFRWVLVSGLEGVEDLGTGGLSGTGPQAAGLSGRAALAAQGPREEPRRRARLSPP
ncbi:MAG: hypothetical protein ACRDX8_14615, partial [Acidimicrobiales bacterium]